MPSVPHLISQSSKCVSRAYGRKLRHVLAALSLRTGIFDLKVDGRTGEPNWLEVNPQGRFLCLEGLSAPNLREPLSRFLEGGVGVDGIAPLQIGAVTEAEIEAAAEAYVSASLAYRHAPRSS